MAAPIRRPGTLSRRRFLQAAATATGVAVVGGIGGLVGQELAGVGSPGPAGSSPTNATSPSLEAGDPRSAPVVPFRDVRQAGIATPAQDRLAFAAFDVSAPDRTALVALLQDLDRRRRSDDPGRAGRAGRAPAAGAAGRHRRSGRPAARQADAHDRLRPEPVRRSVRSCPAAAGRPRRAAAVPRRCPRAGALRRRPGDPGLRRRPPGRLSRGPQPCPARARDGRHALVPARFRPDRLDQQRPGHAAQPAWASRTARTTSWPRARMRCATTSGSATRPTSPGSATGRTWSPGGSGC